MTYIFWQLYTDVHIHFSTKVAHISRLEALGMLNLPRTEKKIMNPADIWTTLLLPTRVNANNPAFSLYKYKKKNIIK